ncbi:MAG: type II toxin-antitoxin system HicA family toxin [Rhodocyclaceae bacterium]|nr:type II toxin-antitoxin system HicA family toxin [Rhodocyclaceae bacterium]
MSHKHANLIRAIFQEPVNCNIHWREIESLLNHLGALVESGHGARFRIVLNRMEFFFHHPHHSNTCSKQSIKDFRAFLARAGVTPSAYELGEGESTPAHPRH